MGEFGVAQPLPRIIAEKTVTDEDVLLLRRSVYGDGVVNRQEAEALFAVDQAVSEKPDSWVEFFVEAVADFLVNRETPVGYVSDENAKWLVRSIANDGVVDHRSELELLVKVIDKAKGVPASLAAFGLEQVAHAVIRGEGALSHGRALRAGVIGEDEVAFLRRVLYAVSGDNAIGISREEAEVLFEINDETSEAENHPAWTELFVKAIACALMQASGYTPPSREEALRREDWLDDTSVNLGGFFSRMFADGLRGYADALRQTSGVENAFARSNDAFERANSAAEAIDASEADWLAERIGRDGKLHENERALLEFIRDESPKIHPALRPLFDKVA
ncbi:hypothetical protein [Oricola sp.]|uniref:hypothetical protein n=1 Tax=Oricola sp. TaxID=1979950 RepID=UPI003BAA4B5F